MVSDSGAQHKVGPSSLAGRMPLTLSQPLIMGIVNVTPDSFSDGGRYLAQEAALQQGRLLAAQGAAILDIGGESTRPGATPVDPQEELRRVLPVVKELAAEGYYVSIDTRHPEVMAASIEAGVAMVNDIEALQAPGALDLCAASDVAVCLMHMQGTPETMQKAPRYDHVVEEVQGFLRSRVDAAIKAGIAADRIVVDPGFGFGKTTQHNLELLQGLPQLLELGCPLLVGLSRKSVLGAVTGRAEDDRVHASIAAALMAVMYGAKIVRVHDVSATRNALAVYSAVQGVSHA